MKKPAKVQEVIPGDTFFYVLPLEQKFTLLRQTLDDHFGEVPVGYRRMMGTYARHISFEREVAKLRVHIKNDPKDYFILFHVSPGELEVSCDCGMPSRKLCKHAYLGLRYLIGHHDESVDLKQFYWPGISTTERGKERYLEVTVKEYYISIKPQKEFGSIYRPEAGFEHFALPQLEKENGNGRIAAALPIDSKRDVLGYCIISRGRQYRSALPVLVPFWGTTDKAGECIVSFKQFLIHHQLPDSISLTPVQLELNAICKQMWDMEAPVEDVRQTAQQRQERKKEMLGLWHKAMAFRLSAEEFLYVNFRMLSSIKKYKPTKSCMVDCVIANTPVTLSFLLTEYSDHFMLEALITDKQGKELTLTNQTPRFFVSQRSGYHYYLLPSVLNNDLLEQLQESNNRLTILRQHFKEFEDKYLKGISEFYSIVFKPLKLRKKVVYVYNAICL
ncbi:hypothetical protein [Mucilaginibacter lacusdianchii]|uniref:hypothetical protein n=1 Tax=Mucilaginibacter lacusdianchii TaxID=2684211 RepID=UPI00131CA4EF|nr:hypothetical protein [Mucilaginibacter sp. JXJ CY 39]